MLPPSSYRLVEALQLSCPPRAPRAPFVSLYAYLYTCICLDMHIHRNKETQL